MSLYIRNEYPWIQHAEPLDWCRVLVYVIKDGHEPIHEAEMLSNYGAYISERDLSEDLMNVNVECWILAPIGREFINPHSAGRTRRQVSFKLNEDTDADIIERVSEEKNVQGYIKALIRQNIYLDDILDSIDEDSEDEDHNTKET